MNLPKDPKNNFDRQLDITEIYINPGNRIIRLKFDLKWLNPDKTIFKTKSISTTITGDEVAEYIDGEREDEKIPVYVYDKLVNQKIPGTEISIYAAMAEMLENFISDNLEKIIGGE